MKNTLIKPVSLMLGMVLIPCMISACSRNIGETDTKKLSDEQNALLKTFPEYFGLDASDGLDVVVWEMSGSVYSFGLLEHSDDQRDWLSDEFMKFCGTPGTNAEQMKTILSSYTINEEKVYILPWQNPVSSYISEYWSAMESEDDSSVKSRRQAYIDNIRKLLF